MYQILKILKKEGENKLNENVNRKSMDSDDYGGYSDSDEDGRALRHRRRRVRRG